MNKTKLNDQLLKHDFCYDDEHEARYQAAKIMAEHYATVENAVVVLSNMAKGVSYISYGRLGSRIGMGDGHEEVESIWEKKVLRHVHEDDMAEKIAWELKFLNFVSGLPADQRSDYYLQHYLRIHDKQGALRTLRHRIFYLDYDVDGNVLLVLCVYTAVRDNQGLAGIICSMDDTIVRDSNVTPQGLLSERECEVLEQIRRGFASKQIAERLCISVNTVNNHRQNIMRRLRCRNTTEAVEVARRLGLLTAE